MQEFIIFLNGLVVSLNIVLVASLVYLLRKNQKTTKEAVSQVVDSHNVLTEAQITIARRLDEIGQIVYSLEERTRQKPKPSPFQRS